MTNCTPRRAESDALCTPPACALLARHQLDLEQARPEFAGDKQPIPRRIVSNAVQDSLTREWRCGGDLSRLQQILEVDPSDNIAVGRRNSRDPVRVPDVRKDLALYVLEFVEIP